MDAVDVAIVGAGPAGLGVALMLGRVPDIRFLVLEKEVIGASFRRWPLQTRFITPSFYSNPFGLADLNAISERSSPVLAARSEHLNGEQYANYLELIADSYQLPVLSNCSVEAVAPLSQGGFVLRTDRGELYSRFLIWATGEFQFPDLSPFPGAHCCRHYATVRDWSREYALGVDAFDYSLSRESLGRSQGQGTTSCRSFNAAGDPVHASREAEGGAVSRVDAPATCSVQELECRRLTIIGGYESAVDSAVQLIQLGHHVRLLSRRARWDITHHPDPSLSLSPYTFERLQQALATGRLELVLGVDVVKVCYEPLDADARWRAEGTEANLPLGLNDEIGSLQRPARSEGVDTHDIDRGSPLSGGKGVVTEDIFKYRIYAADGRSWVCERPPILGTGFLSGGGARQIAELWDWNEDDHVLLTENDESTRYPGLFLVGPQVRQDARIFCFIYKFRQRFARIAAQIAARMNVTVPEQAEMLTTSWGPFGNQDCCDDCAC
ncbi:MAG: NAD(P)-binding domain-containing protein [Lautropia sp.]|nr:NAD(P)-binding domain-containing protein [Lautropia sp.]